MGSQGIRRRKPRRRPPEGDDDGTGSQGWELRNAPYTFEGEIEGLGRFGRGVGSASPRMRVVATLVALAFILPFVIGLLGWVFD
jgi:hypothetical protein